MTSSLSRRIALELNRLRCMIRISGVLHNSNFLLARRCSLQRGQYQVSISERISSLPNSFRQSSKVMPFLLLAWRAILLASKSGSGSIGMLLTVSQPLIVSSGLPSNRASNASGFQSTTIPSPSRTRGPSSWLVSSMSLLASGTLVPC